jgi:hypothetical protein
MGIRMQARCSSTGAETGSTRSITERWRLSPDRIYAVFVFWTRDIKPIDCGKVFLGAAVVRWSARHDGTVGVDRNGADSDTIVELM